jgi:hypothetical protein
LIHNFKLISETAKNKILHYVCRTFDKLIEFSKESKDYLISFLEKLEENSFTTVIRSVNFVSISLTNGYKYLIEFFQRMKITKGDNFQRLVFTKFDNINVWSELIMDKYGKNIVEYFLTKFFSDENQEDYFEINEDSNLDSITSLSPSKTKKILSRLFAFIDSNLIELSKANFSTFAVQTYIQHYRNFSTVHNLILGLQGIVSCRNGVFVVISALKSYLGDELYLLLDKIIDLSEVFSKDVYASTLIEYVFKNHSTYTVQKFIRTKHEYFLGK